MKTFNIPDWDDNKTGDKAAAAISNVGKGKKISVRTSGRKNKRKSNVDKASKVIKKSSPKVTKKKSLNLQNETKVVDTPKRAKDSTNGNTPKAVKQKVVKTQQKTTFTGKRTGLRKRPLPEQQPATIPAKKIQSPIKTSPKITSPPKNKKQSPNKLNPASIVIKKTTKKKTRKTKIKVDALIGKKTSPVVSPTVEAPEKSRADSKKLKKLSEMVTKTYKSKIQHKKSTPLREKMMDRLQSARFRYLNEELYTKDSSGAVKLFEEDPDAFTAYHEGYRQQVRKWPMNPLSKIIIAVKKMPVNAVVADFGCGDAELSKNVKQTVHSFDLIAANDRVTACDMAHVPLGKHTVDVAVFCLSLMGTNLQDYLIEANRVLKVGGTLLIAEVASRFDKVADFLTGVNRYGFTTIHTDFAHNLFYLMHFEKQRDVKNRKTLPILTLNPCIYKKR